jgi:putative ATP-binding cassette transporter
MANTRRTAWSRLLRITLPFFKSETRWRALAVLALLIGLLLSVSGLNVLNSYVGRDFMTAIADREAGRFAHLAAVWALVFGLSTVVAVLASYTEQRFGLMWRDWLTRHLLGRYLGGQAYYRLNGRSDVDNPDQRIAEDIKTFTTTALALLLILVNSTLTLVAFSSILWSITPWLLVAAVAYAAFGSLMTIVLGKRLVGLDVLQLKKEADLRYDLIGVRSNAEAIALVHAEPRVGVRLLKRLAAVVANTRRTIAVNRNLGFFTTGFDYMTQLIPPLIVAPLYIRGEIEFGTVTQAAMAFSFALGAFSLIVKEFQRLTTFAAVVARLGSVWEAMDDAGPPPAPADDPGAPPLGTGPTPDGAVIRTALDPVRLAYEGLTLMTPRDGRVLIRDLWVQVPEGRRLLIMGPNGSGRTSLLRATAGLWTRGEGRIVRPPLEEIVFLPQDPYFEPGPLRDQLGPAARRPGLTDEDVREMLLRVGFDPVLKRVGGLDAEGDWPSVLSRREQQLLAFAGLLLANPRYAVLDEATSAVDSDWGRELYRILRETDITYITVATDPLLAESHDLLLEIGAGGIWQVAPCRGRVVAAAG